MALPVDGFDEIDDLLVRHLGIRTVRLHRTFLTFFEQNRQKWKKGMFVNAHFVGGQLGGSGCIGGSGGGGGGGGRGSVRR